MPHPYFSDHPAGLRLFNDSTTGSSSSIPCNNFSQITYMVHANGTISGGTVIAEVSPLGTEADTWQELETFTLASNSILMGTWPTPAGFFRLRFGDDAAGGGTVDAYVQGYVK